MTLMSLAGNGSLARLQRPPALAAGRREEERGRTGGCCVTGAAEGGGYGSGVSAWLTDPPERSLAQP